jgi:ABC-type transporter Mla maintaining outer membrane lipid asymmetry ATPase subunit MlaF
VLVNLVTGASVPDEGEVRVLGQRTADISGGDEWLASLDRFGIVSERAVMLEGATLEQTLAMPFTLEIDPVPPGTRERVIDLARICGLLGNDDGDHATLNARAGDIAPELRARAHLARAIALDPALLILEHPTATIPEAARAAYAADIVRVTDARRLATLLLTQDQAFAQTVAHRTVRLNPASGALTAVKRGWFR